jgi:protein required for attachment to host cells
MSHDIPNNALIVVADGGKALVLRNAGATGSELELREEGHIAPDSGAQGPSGARPVGDSPGEVNEATFAKQVAQALNTLKQRNDFDALVLVADPSTLGQIRGALHKTVENAVIKSLSKDLTNHSLSDIAKALVK